MKNYRSKTVGNRVHSAGLSYPKEQRIWKRKSDGMLFVTSIVTATQIRLQPVDAVDTITAPLDIHGLEDFYAQFSYEGKMQDV